MITIKEQVANKCKHFTGAGNIICRAGVKYADVKITDCSPYKFPCLKNHPFSGGSCPKVEFKTQEEVEKEVREIEQMGEHSTKAYTQIKEKIKTSGDKRGFIECPSCKGQLNYTAASSNGHIWARCKCGLGWME